MKQKQITSQTTAILYQEPTADEMRPSRKQMIWANLKEFTVFIIAPTAIALPFFTWLLSK
ncbi:hypothetical protein [Acinetobacter gerneri]|uniref:hypothetical protein n=1 Tax=Acinetobacter gerneri TaxID=202952 RepID=UPI003214ED9D